MRHTLLAACAVTALTALVGPAWAHPGFAPKTVDAGQTTEIELAMAHGCDDGSGGQSEPTTVAAVLIPATIAEVVPVDRDGWTTVLTRDDAGRVASVEWTAGAGTFEPEPPSFRLRVTPDTQQDTTTIPFVVFQGCEAGEYRWGAGAVDEPSVDLEVRPGTYLTPDAAPPASSLGSPTDAVMSETPVMDEEATGQLDGAATTDDDAATIDTSDAESSDDRPTAVLVVFAVLAASSFAGVAWLRRHDRAA